VDRDRAAAGQLPGEWRRARLGDMTDRWHQWLLQRRHGGDAVVREKLLTDHLYPLRDNVLDKARLNPGETLLDVGTGDGLIAFGALERLGPDGRVIFSDISQDLLDHCQDAATAEGMLAQCDFTLASADDLSPIADASVDVVTTRSVLIYVKDKATAFSEFYRVLKPGGRISLFEPINVLMSANGTGRFWGLDVTEVQDLAAKVAELYKSIQPPGEDPMLDFDERDLVKLAEQSGFDDIVLELRVAVRTHREPIPWDRFIKMSFNPLIPTLGEAMDQVLTPEETERLTAHLRPLVESGAGRERRALSYLTAVKP
jgi:ubiquinone/menaquinone biosynthesis C-methylase UbiE